MNCINYKKEDVVCKACINDIHPKNKQLLRCYANKNTVVICPVCATKNQNLTQCWLCGEDIMVIT